MKILIMVLSYNVSPYKELMEAQKQTWDSVPVEDVTTLYYHGGSVGSHYFKMVRNSKNGQSEELQLPCTDSYYYMSEKFKRALELVKGWGYDLIFRTNSSSYVNKQRLKEFAETLPTEKLYAGWQIHGNEGFDIVSGAGIFMSRDVAEILREEIDPTFEKEEDYYIGSILHKHGIPIIDDKSRFDVGIEVEAYPPADRYHYKLKNGDRLHDAANFFKLHEKVK